MVGFRDKAAGSLEASLPFPVHPNPTISTCLLSGAALFDTVSDFFEDYTNRGSFRDTVSDFFLRIVQTEAPSARSIMPAAGLTLR